MVSLSQVEDQLKRVGCNFRFWGRPEIRELTKILMPGEIIAQAVNGRYENGFAMLVATDHRLLLIDKKPMFLTLEDVRFDMIAEIDFSAQLFDGTVKIITPNRKLVFTTWSQERLRKVLNYTQQRVSDIRQHYMQRQFQPQQRVEDYAVPRMGGLAVQGGYEEASYQLPPLPLNPYTRTPFIMRKRRVPKFY
ncbi:MAG TPA: PH domain-containing protein [Candidatus Saccharimonadales bacterium]